MDLHKELKSSRNGKRVGKYKSLFLLKYFWNNGLIKATTITTYRVIYMELNMYGSNSTKAERGQREAYGYIWQREYIWLVYSTKAGRGQKEVYGYTIFILYRNWYTFFFWPHRVECRILVPQAGIEPVPPPLRTQSLNHWTAREVPGITVILCKVACDALKMYTVNSRAITKKPKDLLLISR